MYAFAPVGIAANSSTTPAAIGGRSSSLASTNAAAGITASFSAHISRMLSFSPFTSKRSRLMPRAISTSADPATPGM